MVLLSRIHSVKAEQARKDKELSVRCPFQRKPPPSFRPSLSFVCATIFHYCCLFNEQQAKQEFYLSGAESNMDDAMMNMLLGSGAESMEDAMMRMFLGMSSSYSGITSRLCNEDDWEDHPMGELFRAANNHQIFEVESLLEQDKYREGVNELDGDGAGVLHNVALDSKLSEEDAEAIVQAFKNAGADLDLRGGNMMSSETPLHVAAW